MSIFSSYNFFFVAKLRKCVVFVMKKLIKSLPGKNKQDFRLLESLRVVGGTRKSNMSGSCKKAKSVGSKIEGENKLLRVKSR